MDWLLATPQIHSAFSSLGSLEGDTYVVNPNALAILEEINYKLTYEDQTLRTFRRAIGFGQNVRSDLIPLLENAKNDDVLDAVIRILVNLTVPVECLFSVEVIYRTEVGRHTIFELNKLLYTSKEAFTDAKSTKSVIEYMKHILESDSKLSPQKCDQINNCLLLLRNILHIPESINSFNSFSLTNAHAHPTSSATHGSISMQNAILWNLFIQSIDKLLLYLMTCPQRTFWVVTVVQLIALMYKDQHVSTLQKLLNLWFEASLSESSEDNESNTSPPKQGSGDSSPMLTSDPTSDSSDNGSGGSKNECSEDRRQALREETEATLQAVSRKGQEYQDAMLRVPADRVDSAEASDHTGAREATCTSSKAAATSATKTSTDNFAGEIQSNHSDVDIKSEEDDARSEATVIDPIPTIEEVEEMLERPDEEQPAKHHNPTTNDSYKESDNDATFKIPSTLSPLIGNATKRTVPTPAGSDKDLSDSVQKQCPKMPHSGQLNLTKGKCYPQKRECPSSQSELSDCGYGTQVENQESISTSSNDDDAPQDKPQHQKPPCNTKTRNKPRANTVVADKKELRRKKLVKRSKSSLINMKGLVQHTPTDEDISNILKEFTVDFLLKGYNYLVEELHSQLLTNIKIPIDTSHFFWLVTYFLKFAAHLELDLEHINSILTYDVISYLTYEGVSLCEQLELNSKQKGSDLKPYLRRMHLVVTAIREFLQAIETYKKVTHLNENDKEYLKNLQIQISATEDLRGLFVLLLRRFNPSLHTKQYLQDVVVTNHILLLILDSVTELDCNINIKMTEHISQFATLEIMHYYGILLEDFNNNGEFVNDCIFTMMHHIGGDLGQVGTLFQPIILKTFSRIWEADYELCDDWSDLIEYVIHKFINTPQKSPLALPTTSLTELTKEHNLENTVCTWTQEEMDTLYWYYVQSKKSNDVVGKIMSLFSNNGNTKKTRISIIQQLLQQDIITLVEYDDLMKFEDAAYQRALLTTPSSTTTESGIDLREPLSMGKPSDDIQILRDFIVKEKKGKHLVWLQKLLLECCYIKLTLKQTLTSNDCPNPEFIMEPVAYHCILKNKSIPVVQWNNEQASTMLHQPFVLLLHKLGFQLPADAGSVFARIPDFWTPQVMYNLAKKLGSLDKLLLKFDVNELEEGNDLKAELGSCQHVFAARGSTSSASSLDVDSVGCGDSRRPSGVSFLSSSTDIDLKSEKGNNSSNSNSDIFAVPKTKHCNSIIRFTPDPESTPSVPNWLQLVMRSKYNPKMNPAALGIDTETPNAEICITANAQLPSLLTTATDPSSTALLAIVAAVEPECQRIVAASSEPISPTAPDTADLQTSSPAVTSAMQQHPTALLPCPTVNNLIGSNNEQVTASKSGSSEDARANMNKNNDNSKVAPTIKTATATISSLTTTTATTVTIIDGIVAAPGANGQTTATTSTAATTAAALAEHQHQQYISDDSAIKSLERTDSNSSSFFTCSSGINLEKEYSAMVASVYDNESANSDSVSLASSELTRMYVSDEDERSDYREAQFN